MLKTTWKLIKENPWKFFLGSFSAVFLTIVGIVYSDINFEHKDDLVEYKNETMMIIQNLQNRVEDLTNKMREVK
jgi:hypothetical protein